jgi:4-amino-4-deoxy-L-arabinose transferase-like glycosyltransferase
MRPVAHPALSDMAVESTYSETDVSYRELRPEFRRQRRLARIGLCLVLAAAAVFSSYLAIFVFPHGEGADELSHIDHAIFKFRNGFGRLAVEEGLTQPAVSPMGQGHQPPLYYWMGAGVYSLFLDRDQMPENIEYALGLSLHPSAYLLGGQNRCSYTQHLARSEVVPQFDAVQRAVYGYRLLNVLFLLGSIFCTYLAVRYCVPDIPLLALAAATMHAAIPSAIWRSGFINNDNAVVFFCSLSFALCCRYFSPKKEEMPRWFPFVLGVVAAAAFLSKYTGIAALGFAGLAILLAGNPSFAKRIRDCVILVASFLVSIAWDLFQNFRVDGDVLSEAVVRKVVPGLYLPSSHWTMLTDPLAWGEISARFWIEFHNVGRLDPAFDLSVFSVWRWVLHGIGVACLLAMFLPNRVRLVRRSVLLFSAVAVFGVYFVWVHFAASYPLPGGRYIHPAIAPFSLIAVVATASVLRLVLRSWAPLATFGATVAFLGFGWSITAPYLKSQFVECIMPQEQYLPIGVDVVSVDINNDRTDELAFFYRVRNRLFIAQQDSQGVFQWSPDLTRVAVMQQYEMFPADLNGDAVENPIFWHSASAMFAYIDGRALRPLDPKKYRDVYNIDFLKHRAFEGRHHWLLQVGDVNSDGTSDLFLFDPKGTQAEVYSPTAGRDGLSQILRSKHYTFPDALMYRPLLRRNGSVIVGSQRLDGGLEKVYRMQAGVLEPLSLAIRRYDHWFAWDQDGDGNDEILAYNEGDGCATNFVLTEETLGQITAGERESYCVEPVGLRFNRGISLLRVREAGKTTLAVFDRVKVKVSRLRAGAPPELISPAWQ